MFMETIDMILTLDRLGDEIIKALNKNLYVVCYTNQNECSESCKKSRITFCEMRLCGKTFTTPLQEFKYTNWLLRLSSNLMKGTKT